MELDLFPENDVTIVCDTTVPRSLCYDPEPTWLSRFSAMAKAGVHFCLADHTLAEFVNQLEQGDITFTQYQKAINRLQSFISQQMPIMVGKKELGLLCGTLENEVSASVPDLLARSQASWKSMTEANSLQDLYNGVVYSKPDGSLVRLPLKPGEAATQLENERDKFKDHISKVNHDLHSKPTGKRLGILAGDLDSDIACLPPLSIRLDAALRLEDFVVCASQQQKGAYNPDSEQNRNDAIDYHMTWPFMKRYYVCSGDKRFVTRVRLLKGYQSSWVMSPEEVCQAWASGKLTRPHWPS